MDDICCDNPSIGVNGTQFCGSLGFIGSLWVQDVNGLCGNLSQFNQSCGNQSQSAGEASASAGEGGVAANSSAINANVSAQECLANSTWQWAVSNNAQLLYAYMQNHRDGVDALTAYCQANQTQAFGNLQNADVANAFLFDFGNLNATAPAVLNETTGGNVTTNATFPAGQVPQIGGGAEIAATGTTGGSA